MRLIHHLLALALALTAAGGLSSCVVPLATGDQNCVTACTLQQNCGLASAPAGDCNAYCAGFAPILERTGCKLDYEDFTSCVVAEGTCQAASCTATSQAYLSCAQAFCAKTPDDPACQ
ncbi:MAG: hypothetical protein QM820_15155 [Minicystis sp.]